MRKKKKKSNKKCQFWKMAENLLIVSSHFKRKVFCLDGGIKLNSVYYCKLFSSKITLYSQLLVFLAQIVLS